jgi:hypothetical protein
MKKVPLSGGQLYSAFSSVSITRYKQNTYWYFDIKYIIKSNYKTDIVLTNVYGDWFQLML